MGENLDNLLVEAFSQNLFGNQNEDIQEGETVKEEGEIDSEDDNKHKNKDKKSKFKSKHKSKIDSKLKKLKKLSKSESMVKLKSKMKSKLESKIKSKTKSKIRSKIKPKLDSKVGVKSVSKSDLKSSSKIKKSKSSDKSEKVKDKKSDENESEVMKLLLSKQLRSYADIQFKDEELSPEREIPKKSKHKSHKHSDKSKRHKKSKYSDEDYEKQKDSYYSSHSSTLHEDYFYGSYYEGMSSQPSDRSQRRGYGYSRPLSPLYENDWRHKSRSRSPIDYGSSSSSNSSGHRRRSLSPTERYERIKDRERNRDRDRDRDGRRSMTPFYKDGHTDIRDHRRSLSPGGRSYRSSSVASSCRSVNRIDKQKLLEIAKNNLIKMIEKGDLPKGTDINNLKLRHLRDLTTQKGVQQWTEFCRAISTLESGAYDSDLDDDSDNDDTKSVASSVDQPFSIRHPFKVNERRDIQMCIRGFPQLPSRSAKELAIELRETFPVSSGNQHRRKEIEWHEVEVMPPPALPAPKKIKRVDTKLTEILNSPKSIPDQQIAYKIILPTTTTTATAPKTSTTTTSSNTEITTTITVVSDDVITTPIPITDPSESPQPVPAPDPLGIDMCTLSASATNASTDSQTNSDSTPNTSNENKTDSVFPQSSMKIDIGSVMAQRLSAMRKLQEDPHNVVALKQMYQANQMMTEWAESKIVPGQFIGSTGANILSPEQLTGSYNAWTRKDQLKTAAPITDGIGMLLLLKMGWTPGKGLGKNNEGSVDPIVLEIKNDKKGLVAEEEKVRNLPLQLVSTASAGNSKFLSGKNPVSILHELCAKKKWNPPEYSLVNEVGPDHRKNFTFMVLLNGVQYQPSVSSGNKKQAKALAAGVCLQAFGLLPKDNS